MGDDGIQSEATEVFRTMWNELRADERAEIMLIIMQSMVAEQALINMLLDRTGVNEILTDLKSVSLRVATLEHWHNTAKNVARMRKEHDNALGIY